MAAFSLADIPVIETERTVLRPHRLEDFDAYAGMWADPVVTRFIAKPRTREESWQRFLRHAGSWSLIGYGFWAIEEKATGRFIGEAGFHDLKRDITPSIEGIPEAGWGFVADMHGKGIASETVAAFVRWADSRFAGPTVCIIDPANGASLRVAEKNGYRETGRTTYHGEPTILLERRGSVGSAAHGG
ncbi:GNAT family N-acetyltransferase [Aminobacter sp. NyZ550]|jgi:RimJ/RimL family protein N-acetyltransferase|uniref:RimJ/RimL family protein N-acetyltransferase n=1 Tax=Aminobacter ciceronei TaxID=150723 RepID=A0ABR6C201_9HYPH|nr:MULTISPECIES: GNAT family N-acetyltransferase [Aminobacter]WMC97547.1 GNAT family N-acetyltransferase [Aminobacter aminovorans]MBA8905155.1 RimJ/RimL family protein N-acetyltransferase [Aminobacter ciceronei]MBA9018983.1 RimJ/RimL family protein N-acetyltransferase [Aminobacter ciceronei]MRX32691.1 GNAT family N-acetyltransferase [Aminobacter sp. MDW-2]QNH34647.1 GNAT family N-acetyltransferase [Aminobacter sp. MDW-2]